MRMQQQPATSIHIETTNTTSNTLLKRVFQTDNQELSRKILNKHRIFFICRKFYLRYIILILIYLHK